MSQPLLSSTAPYEADLEYFRRSDRNLSVQYGQSSTSIDRYENGSQTNQRENPGSELEVKGIAVPRKRVPVACDRCRKRKIKCSGDEGGNRGCSNCRNAGYPGCRFLRVQSVDPELFNLRVAAGSRSSWQPSTYRYHPYTTPSSHRMNYVSPAVPYGHQINYHEVPGVDFNTYASPGQNLPWTRGSPYSSAYSPYEEDSPSSYVSQPPSFILPNNDPMMNSNTCLISPQANRSHAHSMWLEHPTTLPQTISVTQVMTPSFTASNQENIVPYSSSNHTNTAYLPSERILPSPSTSRGCSSSHVSTLDSLPLYPLVHRPSNGWQTDVSSNTSQGSSIGGYSSSNATQGSIPCHKSMTYGAQNGNIGQSLLNEHCQTVSEATISQTTTSDGPQTQSTALDSNANGQGQQICRSLSRDNVHRSPIILSSNHGYTSTATYRTPRSIDLSEQITNSSLYSRTHTNSCHAALPGDGCGSNSLNCPSISNRISAECILDQTNQ